VKEQKNKVELEMLILERARGTMQLDGVNVYGAGTQWQAAFSAKSHLVVRYVPEFQNIVSELRTLYDLKRVA
jgi:hypothetical protein